MSGVFDQAARDLRERIPSKNSSWSSVGSETELNEREHALSTGDYQDRISEKAEVESSRSNSCSSYFSPESSFQREFERARRFTLPPTENKMLISGPKEKKTKKEQKKEFRIQKRLNKQEKRRIHRERKELKKEKKRELKNSRTDKKSSWLDLRALLDKTERTKSDPSKLISERGSLTLFKLDATSLQKKSVSYEEEAFIIHKLKTKDSASSLHSVSSSLSQSDLLNGYDGEIDIQEDMGHRSPQSSKESIKATSKVHHVKTQKKPKEHKRDWNAEFQDLIDEYEKVAHKLIANKYIFDGKNKTHYVRKIKKIMKKLEAVQDAFEKAAKEIVKVIVLEDCIDDEEKEIPPAKELGGLIGGLKFKYDNIFFKFAKDPQGPNVPSIYGSHLFAAKAANHEYKSLLCCISILLNEGLRFPLFCILDYLGYRITATAVLPIDRSTLLTGSYDGGTSIQTCRDKVMNNMMRILATSLNLEPHYIGSDGEEQELMYVAFDIEGHLGKDGRYYLVDTARLLPPESPDEKAKGKPQLYRLLRHEFVRSNPKPLSPDCYSVLAVDNTIHKKNIVEATHRLNDQVIPEFVKEIHQEKFRETLLSQKITLSQALHSKGINIRYMGKVRHKARDEEVRNLLLTEMIARVLRDDLYLKLQNVNSTNENEYTIQVCRYLNSIFANQTAKFWTENYNGTLKEKLIEKFDLSLDDSEYSEKTDLRNLASLPLIIFRLIQLTGINFNNNIDARNPLSPYDIRMDVKMRRVNYLLMEEGRILAEIATLKSGGDAKELLLKALQKLQDSLIVKPNNYRTLINIGSVCCSLASIQTEPAAHEYYWKTASQCFEEASTVMPDDPDQKAVKLEFKQAQLRLQEVHRKWNWHYVRRHPKKSFF